MLHNDSFLWYLIAFLAVGCLIGMAYFLSGESRRRRRRRKSHSRLISKARQPAVKFSVKTPKEN